MKQISLAVQQYVQDYDEYEPTVWYNSTARTGAPHPTAYLWVDAIYPYVKSNDAFVCPDDTTPGVHFKWYFDPTSNANDRYDAAGSYYVNATGSSQQPCSTYTSGTGTNIGPVSGNSTCGTGTVALPVALSKISNPDTTIFCGDGGTFNAFANVWSYTSYPAFGTYYGIMSYVHTCNDLPGEWNAVSNSTCPGSTATGISMLVARHVGSTIVNVAFCDGHTKAMPYLQIAGTAGPKGNPKYLCIDGG
jgi:prepilin-type processing-associated H-X9-DG protein